MLTHYIIYGLSGLLLETFWTGFGSLFSGDISLTSRTYLWMFFIYGLGVFFEPIHDRIRRENFFIRGLIWVSLIYLIEFSTGFFLDKVVGACPWNYLTKTKFTLFGYIRFDYFPAWFIAGLLFEKYHDFLDKKVFNKDKKNESME